MLKVDWIENKSTTLWKGQESWTCNWKRKNEILWANDQNKKACVFLLLFAMFGKTMLKTGKANKIFCRSQHTSPALRIPLQKFLQEVLIQVAQICLFENSSV